MLVTILGVVIGHAWGQLEMHGGIIRQGESGRPLSVVRTNGVLRMSNMKILYESVVWNASGMDVRVVRMLRAHGPMRTHARIRCGIGGNFMRV